MARATLLMQGAVLSVHLENGVRYEKKNEKKNIAKLMCAAVWWECRDYSLILQCYKRSILLYMYGTGVGDTLNEWMTAAFWSFVRSDISRVEHHVEN